VARVEIELEAADEATRALASLAPGAISSLVIAGDGCTIEKSHAVSGRGRVSLARIAKEAKRLGLEIGASERSERESGVARR
jgi:hypothetical protein